VDWTHLALDRVLRQGVVNMVINIWVPYITGNSLDM
jgi:hypothetical protein